MDNTTLTYLSDSYLFNFTATIVTSGYENDQDYIILDQTIFYPQGGGQPYDKGKISNDKMKFTVNEVRFKEGVVYHIGTLDDGIILAGDIAQMEIDIERRKLNARLHSAGHLIDNAVHELGIKLSPSKGYHYPDGPYVEFYGHIGNDLQAIAMNIENKINQFIKQDFEVFSEYIDNPLELKDKVFEIPALLPKEKRIRLVCVCGKNTLGELCGGTHVSHLNEIGYVQIPKIKAKADLVRVSYRLKVNE